MKIKGKKKCVDGWVDKKSAVFLKRQDASPARTKETCEKERTQRPLLREGGGGVRSVRLKEGGKEKSSAGKGSRK